MRAGAGKKLIRRSRHLWATIGRRAAPEWLRDPLRRAVLTGHAAQDATDDDQREAMRASSLLGALWAPKDAAKQVTAWLQAHGLAVDSARLEQDPDQVWLGTDRYWGLAELEATDG